MPKRISLKSIFQRREGQKRIFKENSSDTSLKESINPLLLARKKRAKDVLQGAKFGVLLGVPASIGALADNPSFRKGIAIVAAWSALGSALTAAGAFKRYLKEVRAATTLVERALTEKIKQDKNLKNFLQQYRYVIVDGKGQIRGTNSKQRLGIGRLRLESRKILSAKQ